MFNIISQEIQTYIQHHTTDDDPLLKEVTRYTLDNHPEHHMMSDTLQGKLLQMVSWMMRPRRVLEIGTFTGYSALCLAKGLAPDGEVHTLELREADAAIANGFFRRSDDRNKIISHVGNALQVIPQLNETWDLVFIDADKTGYIEYFNLVLPKLRKNGFILADNVLFKGEVLQPEAKGKNVKAIKAFNEFLRARTDIDKTILTLRDGLFLIRKL